MEKHPLHLKTPELQTSPEVSHAVERKERKTGEKIPNDPSERIEAYTERLEHIFLNPHEETRKRNIELFRDDIYDKLLIRPNQFPESYFELQKRIARERGQTVEEIPENVRGQMIDTAIEDQRHSLDAWINYLTSDDAVYPAWYKYYVWNQIIKLSQFDKERGEFKKRTDSTVAPFPDIYREPLAQIADVYEKVKGDNKQLKEKEIKELFSKKFPALYAEFIQKSLAASMENREEVKGVWIKYEQGKESEAEKLFASLEGKGTGWCTAGKSTAEKQISDGDFYVYYTNDIHGEPTQPRLAIRMDGQSRIGEVRGVLQGQEVESQLQDVLDEKLNEFGSEADRYHKKSEDMRRLTALEHKHQKKELFTKEDLIFLYEINNNIEGFGNEKDPRIAELRQEKNFVDVVKTMYGYDLENPNRDSLLFLYGMNLPSRSIQGEEHIQNLLALGYDLTPDSLKEDIKNYRVSRDIGSDILTIFEITPEQAAHNIDEISENTKIYVGPLESGIFNKFPKTIEHIYTSFPEKEVSTCILNTEPNLNSPEKILEAVKNKNLLRKKKESYLGDYRWAVEDLINKTEFSRIPKTYHLVELTGEQLGVDKNDPPISKIYARAKEIGLELCPPEIGPQIVLSYESLNVNLESWVAMEPIADRKGDTRVFKLENPDRNEENLPSLSPAYFKPTFHKWHERFIYIIPD